MSSSESDDAWDGALQRAKDAIEAKEQELAKERERAARAEEQLSRVEVERPPANGRPSDPKALRLRSRWGSAVIPAGWVTAVLVGLGTPAAAVVQYFNSLEKKVTALEQIVTNQAKDTEVARAERQVCTNRIASLTGTVDSLSNFVTVAFRKTGSEIPNPPSYVTSEPPESVQLRQPPKPIVRFEQPVPTPAKNLPRPR